MSGAAVRAGGGAEGEPSIGAQADEMAKWHLEEMAKAVSFGYGQCRETILACLRSIIPMLSPDAMVPAKKFAEEILRETEENLTPLTEEETKKIAELTFSEFRKKMAQVSN